MDNQGWIKLHRKILSSCLFDGKFPLAYFKLAIYLLLSVNHTEKKWFWNGKEYTCKPGQLITSRNTLMRELQMTEQIIRSGLKNLERVGFISVNPTNDNSIITICNWETYQLENFENNQGLTKGQPRVNQGLTKGQPRVNQGLTTTKECKNVIMEECENENKSLYSEIPKNSLADIPNIPGLPDLPEPEMTDEMRIAKAWSDSRPGCTIRPNDRNTVSNYLASKGIDWCLEAIEERTDETYIGQCFFAYEQLQKINGRAGGEQRCSTPDEIRNYKSKYGIEIVLD